MKITTLHDLKLFTTPAGEKTAVVAGRHEKHGCFKQHTVAVVELDAGRSSSPHYHKEREESYIFLTGEGTAQIDETTLPVKAGDVLSTHAGEQHTFTNTGNSPLRYLVVTAPLWLPEDSHTR